MTITLSITELRNLLTQAYIDGRTYQDPQIGAELEASIPTEQYGKYNLRIEKDYVNWIIGSLGR